MNAVLLSLALSQPITLHTDVTDEGAYYRACFERDIYVRCETTAAARYYQHEMRPRILHKSSLDNFVEIGRNRSQFPTMTREGPMFVVLWVKQKLDLHHLPNLTYENRPDYSPEHVAEFGMVDLGSEGVRVSTLPLPWEESYTLTGFQGESTE